MYICKQQLAIWISFVIDCEKICIGCPLVTTKANQHVLSVDYIRSNNRLTLQYIIITSHLKKKKCPFKSITVMGWIEDCVTGSSDMEENWECVGVSTDKRL